MKLDLSTLDISKIYQPTMSGKFDISKIFKFRIVDNIGVYRQNIQVEIINGAPYAIAESIDEKTIKIPLKFTGSAYRTFDEFKILSKEDIDMVIQHETGLIAEIAKKHELLNQEQVKIEKTIQKFEQEKFKL